MYSPYIPNQNQFSLPSEPQGGWGNYPIPSSPYTPDGWAGQTVNGTIQNAQNKVYGAVDEAGQKVRGFAKQAGKTFLDALPYLAVGGTLMGALWGQDNDALYGNQAKAEDIQEAGYGVLAP